jgi:hypothetical protein
MYTSVALWRTQLAQVKSDFTGMELPFKKGKKQRLGFECNKNGNMLCRDEAKGLATKTFKRDYNFGELGGELCRKGQ